MRNNIIIKILSKLKIGVNTRLLIDNKLEGIGYFTLKNLERLTKEHPDDRFIFFFDRPYNPKFVFAPNVTPVVIPLPARHPILWYVYFNILLPVWLKRYKVDVFFSPENYIPCHCKTPCISTIHDINFEHKPEYIGDRLSLKYMKHFFPRFARKSARILTVSDFSRQDISKTYGIPSEKIYMVESAANELYKTMSESENIRTRERYTASCPYFYFVGALHERKNLANLFTAFDMFKSENENNVKLVIIGNRKWWSGNMAAAYERMRHKDDVIFTGRLPLEEVNRIASASIALVFVSFFEGFGVPPLEAYRSGTAVICSDTTSMPEVNGDAAMYVNPYKPEEICRAMTRMHNEPETRRKLIAKGKEQEKSFSWDKTADLIWKTIVETTDK